MQPPKYEKVGRALKARSRASHEVQGANGPRLTKHGVIIHYRKPGHNSATCAAKKEGQPAVKKTKRATTTIAEPEQQPIRVEQYFQVCAYPHHHHPHVYIYILTVLLV